jgi:hypothetical protein
MWHAHFAQKNDTRVVYIYIEGPKKARLKRFCKARMHIFN